MIGAGGWAHTLNRANKVIVCHSLPHDSTQEWQKIEEAVAELPEQSPLISVLQDYMDLLDKLKIANQAE